MRDINRIPEILIRIQKIWEKNPDLRLGQLIGNVIRNETLLYYIEDDELIKKIEELYLDIK